VSRPPQTSQAEFIAAAVRFIDEYGVDGFSLRSLAGTMNLSHAALYRHFGNKEELVDALIDNQLGEAIEGVDLKLAPEERLRDIAYRLRNHFDQHPNLLKPWINGTGRGKNAFQVAGMTIQALREIGIAPARLGHWLRVLENFVVGGMVYDYAASPAHLDIRAHRLNILHREGFLDESVDSATVAQQNRAAFEEALGVLIDTAVGEGR
jgi:TetR/AcrR family transcriptional regulator, tetracycline repressor protein